MSPRTASAWAEMVGLAKLSDVAPMERLQKSGERPAALIGRTLSPGVPRAALVGFPGPPWVVRFALWMVRWRARPERRSVAAGGSTERLSLRGKSASPTEPIRNLAELRIFWMTAAT